MAASEIPRCEFECIETPSPNVRQSRPSSTVAHRPRLPHDGFRGHALAPRIVARVLEEEVRRERDAVADAPAEEVGDGPPRGASDRVEARDLDGAEQGGSGERAALPGEARGPIPVEALELDAERRELPGIAAHDRRTRALERAKRRFPAIGLADADVAVVEFDLDDRAKGERGG